MVDGASGSRPVARRSTVAASTGVRALALLTTVATYLEIVLGGTVRATGSGEACPDWPTCHGRAIPSFSEHVLIEYGHRLTASLVSVLVVALLIAALWGWRQPRQVRLLAIVALGLLVLQVALGGVTVLADLPPQIVTAHLATATALLGVLTTLSIFTFRRRSLARDRRGRAFLRAAMVAATATFLLILTGSAVVGSDASLACTTWPLCNGQLVPTGGHAGVDINYLHRVMAVLVGLAIIATLLYGARIRRERPALFWASVAAVALFLAQALIGAGNVWLQLAAGVRVAHLAAAQGLWVLTTALTVVAATAPRQAAPLAAEAQRRRLPPAPAPNRRARFGDRTRRAGGPTEGGRT